MPFKRTDSKLQNMKRYGGFTSISGTYFFLVEHEKSGKRIRTVESLPLCQKYIVDKSAGGLTEYCIEELCLQNPSIRIQKIPYQAYVKVNGYYAYISGKSEDRIILRNAVSLCLSLSWIDYIKQVEKANELAYYDETKISLDKNLKLYRIIEDKHINAIFSKRQNAMGDVLKNGEEPFEKLNLSDQCHVLLELLKLSNIGIINADLSLIGSKNNGVIRINKNISTLNEMKLITQSVTGIYEKEIDMLTI